VHLPEAAKQALKTFGFAARELLQREMARAYVDPTAYTLRSPVFDADDLTLTIGISDRGRGTPPRNYLAPTDKSDGAAKKEVMPTPFAGAIKARYGFDDLPVPVRSSRAGRQFLNSRGNLKPRKVQSLLDNLQNPGRGPEDYFVIKPRTSHRLPPGIYRRYRRKSAGISPAFVFKDQPTQATVLNFQEVLETAARSKLPAMIERKLKKILG